MTIKKKVTISNVLMVCIPLLLAIAFLAVAFGTWGNRYWEWIEEMMADRNGIYSAQSIFYLYKEDLQEGREEQQGELEDDLERIGYNLRVTLDGEIVYDRLTEEDEDELGEYLEHDGREIQQLAMSTDGVSILRSVFDLNGQECVLEAVGQTERAEKGAWSPFQEYIQKLVVYFLFFLFAIVLISNAALSGWIVHLVLKPLKLLENGVKAIAGGDLDTRISYDKKDEFGEMCAEFDGMRVRLKQFVEERLKYEQYRRELLAGISHDIRTPLTSIKGYAEGLLDGIANTEEMRQRYYRAIHIRALDMEALVNNLSVFSRLENGQFRYRLEPVDMAEYLRELIAGYETEAQKKKLLILLDDAAKRKRAAIDTQEMHRVFINLFENSVKYRTRDKSVIRIALADREEWLEIEVSDDGPGVNESEYEKIFESFYRGDKSRTSPGNGSGLGLAIVRQIIGGHHGTIRACAPEGNSLGGLTLLIRLPLLPEEKGEDERL